MRRPTITTGLVGAALVAAGPLAAQDESAAEATEPTPVTWEVDPNAAEVPWGPGEYLEYGVKAGFLGAGKGTMSVPAIDTVRGFPTYQIHMTLDGGLPFGLASIDDRYTSWMDTEALMSRRYIRDVDQGDYRARRVYEFYPEELWWERTDVQDDGDLASALPLDETGFIYFLRTLDYEVGKSYSFNKYFKEEGNPVRIEVLRRDRRKTDAGEFDTIVIRPIIPGSNLFDKDSSAEIHLSDDENRYVVYMKSETGILGISLSLELKSATPGTPIHGKSADGQ